MNLLRLARKLTRALGVGPKGPQFLRGLPDYARHDIGEWTYGEPRILFGNEGTRLKIGRYCSIADGVVIALGGEHRTDWVTTFPFPVVAPQAAAGIAGHPRSKGDVVIGSDVWIGREALILSGVSVGDGAVIGARAVVARDVAPYEIVAGNPARHVRFRFEPEIIAGLRRVAWWNWPHGKVLAALPLLLSSDLNAFLEKHGDCQHDTAPRRRHAAA